MTRSVPEWIGKTPDSAIPPRVKLRVISKWEGVCRECCRHQSLFKYLEIDHIIPIINGGENRESNLQPLCDVCHSLKTKTDVKEKSKVARLRVRDLLPLKKKERKQTLLTLEQTHRTV